MDRFFDANNPLMKGLSRLVDLVILNVFTLICSLPIVTMGAAMTAMNYVLLHYVRDDDSYTRQMFFKSFKENLKQGIKAGLIYVFLGLIAAGDFLILRSVDTRGTVVMMYIITFLLLFIMIHGVYTFALLSRYENSVRETMVNALKLMFTNIPRSIGMMLAWLIWFGILWYLHKAAPLAILLYGVSLPGYMCTLMYDSIFKRMESQE